MASLLDRTIVITGASSGIGRETALKAAKHGAKLVLIARSEEKLKELSRQIAEITDKPCWHFALDVSDYEKVSAVFKRISEQAGPVDILLNNAGFGVFETFHEADFQHLIDMFEVNVLWLMACTKAVLPAMLERNQGHIINVASQAGKLATPKSSGYSASKHAVIGFTNSLRMELAHTGIHVSAVNPGPVETNFFNIADRSGNYVKNVQKFMLSSDEVSARIIQLMLRPKRELNMPRWMNLGSKLYNLFPAAAEKLIGGMLNQK